VITVDLLLAARNRGYDAQLVRGDVDLLVRELKQQHPLILMLRVLDAPGNGDDRFHYVVLSGVDSERELVLMHYGDSRKRWVPIQAFQVPWAAGGYATLLIGPGKAQVATEADFRRAVVLEDAGNTQEAIALYRHFLHSHPQSALAWTNLGNAHAGSGEDHLAEVAYRNALFLEKDDRDALNNLAWLLLTQRRLEEAEALARRAVHQNGVDQYLALDTLARVLLARARCEEAIATFQEGLRGIPDAQAEIRAMMEDGHARAQRDCGLVREAR
jgi:tetratricopeptide (TPR) repeat protein